MSKGYVSYFKARAPSEEEMDQLEQIPMTGDYWDPHSNEHEVLEKAAVIETLTEAL